MSDHTYEMIEVVGCSKESIEEAVHAAVARAVRNGKTVRWFEVLEARGKAEGGKVASWQVRVRLGAVLPE